MRDARAEGREERGPRRDRHLARRNRPLIEPILRVAAAILVDTLAFIIWNIAPRSPLQLVRDIGRGARHAGTFAGGLVRFVAGLALLAGSVSIVLPLLLPERALIALVTWTALTGLLVDQVAGIDLYGGRPGTGSGR